MRKLRCVIILLLLSLCDAWSVDWQAQWIGAPWDGETFDKKQVPPAPNFRKKFKVSKNIKSATAYVTGLGFFEFYVNGRKVGDEVLSPNETSYSHRPNLSLTEPLPMDDTNWRGFRVLYLTYDISGLLSKGDNELGALLGNGFFAIDSRRWVAPYGTPRFICQVEIAYSDGTSEVIVSDESWDVCKSPILLNDLYEGEVYDARLQKNPTWEKAVIRKAPDGTLMPQDGPADRVVETIKPKSIVRLDDGRYEVDFGDYVSGWVRLKNFKAASGTEISLEFPIETTGNGIYKYICDGSKVKSYAPRFCWWVFNKVTVSGWPGELKPSNIVAEVVHSDVREDSEFACSNELINRINRIWKRTQTDNMHLGVVTDCPHREKGPYTGDGEVACVTVLHNFDVRAFYRKWLHDMSDCQDLVTGYVPNGAPWHPGCGGGVPWGAAMCIIPWEYYLHYGDISVLEENFVPMKEQVRHMLSWRLDDGTMLQQIGFDGGEPIYYFNLGEWCPPFWLPSENLVHTWYLWRCASYTANAAKALGRESEYVEYKALADRTAAAFHKAFYNPETGSYTNAGGTDSGQGYGTGSGEGYGDGSNIFALAMGVPDEYRTRVIDAVKAELEANRGHIYTGIYASSLFFEVLCDNGLAEQAYEAMTKTDYPGFGWMLENGAQTFWEQWDGTASRNHPMFGGALAWLYRRICGVQTDDAEPGFRHIILKPTPVGDLTWASYSTQTSYGKLKVFWKLSSNGKFTLKVTVPKSTRATVSMPDGSPSRELRAGKHRIICR